MQAKPISRTPEGHGNKLLQRAVLALVLHEFPAQFTRDELLLSGFARDYWDLEQAIRDLTLAGLLWRQGEVTMPSLPARHFHWLEWS
jgi:hypothetical protein